MEKGWMVVLLHLALLYKETVGIWLLFATAIALTIFKPSRFWATLPEELILVLPALSIFVFVSSQTGFNHHMRYILPAFPAMFIWISKIGRLFDGQFRNLLNVPSHWDFAGWETNQFAAEDRNRRNVDLVDREQFGVCST